MKLALIGYGKMGRMVEGAAERAGHEIVCTLDIGGSLRGRLEDAQVCIDFSEPGAVIDNLRMVSKTGVRMVVGTTGWYDRLDEARRLVEQASMGFVYGSNFSIGVNLMFRVVKQAAELFAPFEAYDAYIEEAHHQFKKDAPSGTALSLKGILEKTRTRPPSVASTRAGYIPGTHVVGFDSPADTIEVIHRARDRSGFAEGAVAAAEWIQNRTGFYDFTQVIDERLAALGGS